MSKTKKKSGLAAVYAAGKKVVTVPFDEADHAAIAAAARAAGLTVTAFIRHHSLIAAKKQR